MDTGDSTSASEYLYVGLKPYMDITTVEEKTYGKFYGGPEVSMDQYLEKFKDTMPAKDYRKAKKISDRIWMYIISFAFTDCDFANPYAETEGILPDIPVSDNPLDGYPLGDEHETMLRTTLDAIRGRSVRQEHPAVGFSKRTTADGLTNLCP